MERTAGSNRGQLRAIAHKAMVQRGLQPDFSPEAVAQLAQITAAASETSPAIKDLRKLLWSSIDNDDSRDLDQLSVAEVGSGGAVKILVAIADVDALVKKDSPIDGHARANTTSVYTAAAIFPMLPERLSTDLTSLNPAVDRLALVIEMSINPEGVVVASSVYRALVHNQAKLAYNSVAAWLDGGPVPPALAAVPGLDANLKAQLKAAAAMKARRHDHGALALESQEARPVFEGEVLTDLKAEQRNPAKDLIEDFMIGANGVVAKFLVQKSFPSMRRVLRNPERWARIVALAAAQGEKLPAAPDGLALSQFLDRRHAADPAGFADLSLSVVKLLGRGEYAVDVPGQTVAGHFGLAVKDYAHSTAPNRRFPDLITQRLVKAALAGQPPPYSNSELGTLAARCTAQEDAATKVERQVRKSAAAALLAGRAHQQFDAIVTGASEKGTWVRIVHPAAEGKLVHGAKGLDVGDTVRVELLSTDIERGFVDFGRVEAHAR
jgi:exoribonuclease-2